MHKLDRYIARNVLGSTVLVVLVLSGLDILFTVIDELGDTSETYTTLDAIWFVLLFFPGHLYEMLPMATLIGSLTGLGVLASSNELVVMQVAGISNKRIAWAVMKPAALIMVFGMGLGEWVVPPLQIRAEVNKSIANGQAVGLSRFGHWERDGDAYMHFDTIEPEGILYGVLILVFDARQQLVKTVEAERAEYGVPSAPGSAAPGEDVGQLARSVLGTDAALTQETVTSESAQNQKGQPNWLLINGRERVFSRDNPQSAVTAQAREFTTQLWQLDLTPDILQVLIIDPDYMAISDLYQYANRFSRQGQNADGYFLSFWKKVFQPLTTAVLVLVAISFIFGPLREVTMGSRLFVAILFGLGFTIVQRLMHTVSLVYQFDALTAVVLPILLCAVLGIWLFRKAA